MAKKKNNTPLILAIAGGVLLVGALVYVFVFTSIMDVFTKGKAEKALLSGRVEVASEKDINDYFVFLPAEEVKALLADNKGKFLFPQIDLTLQSGVPLVVEKKEGGIEGTDFDFVAISGVPAGVKVYSTSGGYLMGGILSGAGGPYAWVREAWAEEGNDDVMITFFPTLNLGLTANPAFSAEVSETMFSPIEFGAHFANILTDRTLPDSLASGANIATAVAGEDGTYDRLTLESILTKNGRIVMVQR